MNSIFKNIYFYTNDDNDDDNLIDKKSLFVS